MSTAFAYEPVRRPVGPSASAAAPRPEAPRPDPAPAAAPAVRARPRVLAAGALVAGVGCVLAGQLLLSIQTAGGAYALHRLQTESVQLARQQQVRTERLDALASPQHLAAQAASLGLVPSVAPAYLRLSDGRVLGRATRATTGTLPAAVPNALLAPAR